MNKHIFSIICIFLLVAVTVAFAGNDNTGTSAANFLKIGVGSRAAAMGDAYVALANDVTALYWNPAGIASINGTAVGISYTNWILDINHSFTAIAHNFGDFGVIGVSLNYLSMGEMEHTTPSEPHGTGAFFEASDMALGIAYARNLTDRFAVGVKVKFIRESISFSNANTIALDVGTQFVTGFRGMRLGMNISNFGGKMLMSGTDQLVKAKADPIIEGVPEKTSRLETESWTIPLTFRFGVSMDMIKRESNVITVNADFTDPRDVAPIGNFGVEYNWNNLLYLRGGLVYRPEDFDEQRLADKEEVVQNYTVKFSFGGGL
ncbi:MAG: PorV/PorQ family protein, partial [bacterium]